MHTMYYGLTREHTNDIINFTGFLSRDLLGYLIQLTGRTSVFPVAIGIFYFTFLVNQRKLDGTSEASSIHGAILFFFILFVVIFSFVIYASRRSIEVKASRVYHLSIKKEKVHWVDRVVLTLFSFFDLGKDWTEIYPQLRKPQHKYMSAMSPVPLDSSAMSPVPLDSSAMSPVPLDSRLTLEQGL